MSDSQEARTLQRAALGSQARLFFQYFIVTDSLHTFFSRNPHNSHPFYNPENVFRNCCRSPESYFKCWETQRSHCRSQRIPTCSSNHRPPSHLHLLIPVTMPTSSITQASGLRKHSPHFHRARSCHFSHGPTSCFCSDPDDNVTLILRAEQQKCQDVSPLWTKELEPHLCMTPGCPE